MSNINDRNVFVPFPCCIVSAVVVLSILSFTSLAMDNSPATMTNDAAIPVEGYYHALTCLTAKVRQKNYFKSLDKTRIFEGTLAVKKPGRLRLDYTNGQTIVINGGEAWFYSKKNRQAIKRSFEDFERANIPVAFLLGAATIHDDFDVAPPKPDRPRVLDLLPKRQGSAMKRLRLETDESGRITRLTIFDMSGNITEISFSDIREGGVVEDDIFMLNVPEGTEVIE